MSTDDKQAQAPITRCVGADMPLSLYERALNAQRHAAGPPRFTATMSEFLRQAIERLTLDIERDLNDGQPFPPRPGAKLDAEELARLERERLGG